MEMIGILMGLDFDNYIDKSQNNKIESELDQKQKTRLIYLTMMILIIFIQKYLNLLKILKPKK